MKSRPPEDPALHAFLDDVADVAADDPAEALELLDEASPDWHDHPELHYFRGDLVWTIEGPGAAEPHFRRALEREPRFADAHHALAQVHEAMDERPAMIRHYLEVLKLDAHDDIGAGIGTKEDQRFIAGVAEAVLEHLPEEFKGRLGNVPVVLEARPAKYLVQDGFDPRALGLFEGPDHFHQRGIEAAAAPSRIVLYYANLLAMFADEDELREQVEVTILHEIGHYFGLDEDDMQRLGLD
ncbi:metallopeptidase family protein [Nannocystis sp. ILAH1]|uniref:metallopeptidase family protein n=1 Tax=unclassified Nannocystis TaxID=2627009 RepID=UPI002271EBC7|nr:metallopeptidase family protein [Nannocystis sp. ILAH1]MCY1066300.1 metallopeptidase family protein [Nannocystis sp. RBIL2]